MSPPIKVDEMPRCPFCGDEVKRARFNTREGWFRVTTLLVLSPCMHTLMGDAANLWWMAALRRAA